MKFTLTNVKCPSTAICAAKLVFPVPIYMYMHITYNTHVHVSINLYLFFCLSIYSTSICPIIRPSVCKSLLYQNPSINPSILPLGPYISAVCILVIELYCNECKRSKSDVMIFS